MLEVQRTTAKAFEEPPLSWKPVKNGEKTTALFTCAKGHSGLITDHDIGETGIVQPSVVCTEDGCDFHDNIVLVGWSA